MESQPAAAATAEIDREVRSLAALVFGGGVLGIECGILWMQPASDARSSALLNGFTATGISVAISVMLWRNVFSAERARGTIARQEREIARLVGLLPVCAWCKKTRDDAGYWKGLDIYIRDRGLAKATHSMCPDCSARCDAELDAEVAAKTPRLP